MNTKQQCLANIHDTFVQRQENLLSLADTLMALPQATDNDRKGFQEVKLLLRSAEAVEIEQELSDCVKLGVMKRDILEKVEKLNEQLVDFALEHINASVTWKAFMKQLFQSKSSQDKSSVLDLMRYLDIEVI